MLELNEITVERQGRKLLEVEQLKLSGDELTVILGHNGSGKSTLMKLLARQMLPSSGKITLKEKSLATYRQKELARHIAYLPQNIPDIQGISVHDLVLQGRYPWRGMVRRWTEADQAAVTEAMKLTNVGGYADQMINELSGGERQRAWISMLLAQEAPILLLDEPTSALDLVHQYELMTLAQKLNREKGKGLVVILHDVNLATRFATRILALKKGRLWFDGNPENLLDEARLSSLYDIDIRLCDHPVDGARVAVVA